MLEGNKEHAEAAHAKYLDKRKQQKEEDGLNHDDLFNIELFCFSATTSVSGTLAHVFPAVSVIVNSAALARNAIGFEYRVATNETGTGVFLNKGKLEIDRRDLRVLNHQLMDCGKVFG